MLTFTPVVREYTVLTMLHQSAAAEQMMFNWPGAWAVALPAATTNAVLRRSRFKCGLLGLMRADSALARPGREERNYARLVKGC
jgi:hypothetical protein